MDEGAVVAHPERDTTHESERKLISLPFLDRKDGRSRSNSKAEPYRYLLQRRLHFSLDIDSYETPLMAFRNKRATEAIRKGGSQWMEKDTYE